MPAVSTWLYLGTYSENTINGSGYSETGRNKLSARKNGTPEDQSIGNDDLQACRGKAGGQRVSTEKGAWRNKPRANEKNSARTNIGK